MLTLFPLSVASPLYVALRVWLNTLQLGGGAYINNTTKLTPLDKARFGETEEL